MATNPAPIVVVSGSASANEMAFTFRALEAGALAVIARPQGIDHREYGTTAKELVQTVKLMSEIKVVRRWPSLGKKPVVPARLEPVKTTGRIQVVAIGGSTGGPLALEAILSRLPRKFPVPLLIVQHMATGFTQGFADWLNETSAIPVSVATSGELVAAGNAYIAPDGQHMVVGPGGRILLDGGEPENGSRPSVSCLFNSVVKIFGQNAIGVLLTGMGSDGSRELKLMKDSGAITIVQDRESSVVYGMPGEAVRIGAATHVLPPPRIGQALADLVSGEPRREEL